MSTGYHASRLKVCALKCLLLAALAWAQVSIAAHQFEHHEFDHHADDSHASCAICVQLDRDDVPPVFSTPLSCVSPTSASVPSDADTIKSAEGFSLYSARASP